MRQGIPRYYFLHLFLSDLGKLYYFFKKINYPLYWQILRFVSPPSSNTYPNLLSPSSFIHTLLGAKYKGREGVVCGDSK